MTDLERYLQWSMAFRRSRGILFGAFKKYLVKEAKVSLFSSYVAEHTMNRHAQARLADRIIGMAQHFVGSNNINLMYSGGRFGTRNQGGEDHWNAEHNFTKLSPITRLIFPEDDDTLLEYPQRRGRPIERTWYLPIIPMVLVNGSEVTADGCSNCIPNYYPREIINNLRRLLNNVCTEPMHPWYRGFKGSIIKETCTKAAAVTYTSTGVIQAVDSTTLRITELPICCWTQDYKKFLQSMAPDLRNKDKEAIIEEFIIQSDDEDVCIDIILSEENMDIAKQEGLEKMFKLTTTIGPINMQLLDPDGNIRKYDTPEHILEEFIELRIGFYEKRREALLENMELGLKKLGNKIRFICCIVDGEIIIGTRRRAELLLELQQKKFDPLPEKNEETAEAAKGFNKSDYEYLLSMPIGTLTLEKIQELVSEKGKLENELKKLRQASPRSLWLSDLDALEKELDAAEERTVVREAYARTTVARGVAPKRQPKRTGARAKKVEAATRQTIDNALKPVLARRAAPRKKPAKKARTVSACASVSGNKERDIPSLKDRLAVIITNDALDDSGNAAVRAVTKHGAPRKKQNKKASAPVTHEVRGVPELKHRLATSNLNDPSPDHSAMESEITEQQKGKKGKKVPSKRGAAKKAPSSLVEEATEVQNEKEIVMGQHPSDQPDLGMPCAERVVRNHPPSTLPTIRYWTRSKSGLYNFEEQ